MNTTYVEPATGDKEIAFITSLAAELWSEIDLNEVRATKRDLCIAAARRINLLKADNKFLNARVTKLEEALRSVDKLYHDTLVERNDALDRVEELETFIKEIGEWEWFNSPVRHL